jgi:hypothetical protein
VKVVGLAHFPPLVPNLLRLTLKRTVDGRER